MNKNATNLWLWRLLACRKLRPTLQSCPLLRSRWPYYRRQRPELRKEAQKGGKSKKAENNRVKYDPHNGYAAGCSYVAAQL